MAFRFLLIVFVAFIVMLALGIYETGGVQHAAPEIPAATHAGR